MSASFDLGGTSARRVRALLTEHVVSKLGDGLDRLFVYATLTNTPLGVVVEFHHLGCAKIQWAFCADGAPMETGEATAAGDLGGIISTRYRGLVGPMTLRLTCDESGADETIAVPAMGKAVVMMIPKKVVA